MWFRATALANSRIYIFYGTVKRGNTETPVSIALESPPRIQNARCARKELSRSNLIHYSRQYSVAQKNQSHEEFSWNNSVMEFLTTVREDPLNGAGCGENDHRRKERDYIWGVGVVRGLIPASAWEWRGKPRKTNASAATITNMKLDYCNFCGKTNVNKNIQTSHDNL